MSDYRKFDLSSDLMRSNGLTGIIWEYLAEACIALQLRCMSATATVVLCSSTPKCGSDLLAREHT
jgi:hypothetical protein